MKSGASFSFYIKLVQLETEFTAINIDRLKPMLFDNIFHGIDMI